MSENITNDAPKTYTDNHRRHNIAQLRAAEWTLTRVSRSMLESNAPAAKVKAVAAAVEYVNRAAHALIEA